MNKRGIHTKDSVTFFDKPVDSTIVRNREGEVWFFQHILLTDYITDAMDKIHGKVAQPD